MRVRTTQKGFVTTSVIAPAVIADRTCCSAPVPTRKAALARSYTPKYMPSAAAQNADECRRQPLIPASEPLFQEDSA
eukprot:1167-Heterococcus_DN1.PRE.1